MTRALALIAALTLAASCSSKGAKKIPRDEDAPAVVVVDRQPGEIELGDEVEPNDQPEQATPVELGAGVRGALDGEDDVDLYRVTVTEKGQLEALVGGIEGVDLIFELRDAEGEVLVVSDRGPAGTVEGVPNHPVEPGTYLLAITEFVKKSDRNKKGRAKRKGPSPTYQLTARFRAQPPEEDDEHEREPNDDAAGALALMAGDEYSAWIGWNDDVDLWKLPLEGFTAQYGLDIDVSAVPGVWLRLDILDSGGKAVLTRKAEKDEPVAVRGLVPAEGEPHYFVKVHGRRSNPVDPYVITARTRLLDLDEEIEPNDDADSANPLRESTAVSDGRRRGYLAPGDVDVFRLEAVGEAVLLTLSVAPPSGLDVAVTVRSDRGDELGAADAGKVGAREELVGLPIPAGTAVIVEIRGTGGSDQPYELRWSVQPDDRFLPEPTDPDDDW
jgi:hypothetical protein